MENSQTIETLAEEVILLSRNILVMNLRFLDSAFNKLPAMQYNKNSITTDGICLYYDPKYLLLKYKQEQKLPSHYYLHVIMHCIFYHPFTTHIYDKTIWNLACDIAVEYVIINMRLDCVETSKDIEKEKYLIYLSRYLRYITAEKIYEYYINNPLTHEEYIRLYKLFTYDDHSLWYNQNQKKDDGSGGSSEEANKGENNTDNTNNENNESNTGNENNESNTSNNLASVNNKLDNTINSIQEKLSYEKIMKIKDEWNRISCQIQTDLETISKNIGKNAGALKRTLSFINREKYDYTSFLKKFAVLGEEMEVNDDEFDYIYYTYGLNLYNNMPLIEPLEYKEVKRIKEFVIAIDTSGSVLGEKVKSFLTKTYNILSQQDSFFTKINLYILQCDTEIQNVTKITSVKEFTDYIDTMEVYGFGGTDFRPVFRYVDDLINNKLLNNLKGLLYFTDGYGEFPSKQPDYMTAFIFTRDYNKSDYENNLDVPVWAVKLVLDIEDI